MSSRLVTPSVFIGMPAYRGSETIEESLRSIAAQSLEDYRVVISVDGGDKSTAEICRKYSHDSRYQVIVQPVRLGWAANLNSLMAACDCDFFCYWQQDDLCATSYLEVLHAQSLRHPEAACVYSDVQWFGGRFGRESLPSITGAPLARVLAQVERAHFAPFRGLIRTAAIRAAGPIRITPFDSRLEDIVWIAKIAAQGELHRAEDTLYFKRVHRHNTHSALGERLTMDFRRDVWVEFGLGMLEILLPMANGSAKRRMLDVVLERLILPRDGRWRFFHPEEDHQMGPIEFANLFVDAAVERFGEVMWQGRIRFPAPIAVLEMMSARPDTVTDIASERIFLNACLRDARRTEILGSAARSGSVQETFASGSMGTCLLEDGWFLPESWGVWSRARKARLTLPIPTDGFSWRVLVHGHAFVAGARDGIARVILRLNQQVVSKCECTAANPGIAADFVIQPPAQGYVTIEFDMPDAASPADLGLSEDPRILGVGLTALSLTRQSAAE